MESNQEKAMLKMFTASDVTPKEIDWLWYPYLPFGKVSLIHGESGDGKSTFALNLAAILTRGDTLPFTEASHGPMRVIYVNSEDAADDTVVPRFMKAGGVRDRLIFISEEEDRLSFSDERIKEAIQMTGARVVILDPLAAYIGSKVCMNNANETRSQFMYLIDVARETGCAIIIVAHMNKAEGLKATSRVSGSVDIVAAARSAILISRAKEDPDQRVLAHSKSNLARLGDSILFSVGDGVVEFEGTVDITADQLVGAYSSSTFKGESKQDICRRELLSLLAGGPVLKSDIVMHMRELGISQRTCEVVRESMPEICCKRESGSNKSLWYLPEPQGTTTQQQDWDNPLQTSLDDVVVPF